MTTTTPMTRASNEDGDDAEGVRELDRLASSRRWCTRGPTPSSRGLSHSLCLTLSPASESIPAVPTRLRVLSLLSRAERWQLNKNVYSMVVLVLSTVDLHLYLHVMKRYEVDKTLHCFSLLDCTRINKYKYSMSPMNLYLQSTIDVSKCLITERLSFTVVFIVGQI